MTVGSPAETDRIVSVSGAVITLKTPLADAHPAGAAVTSTPGAITGDSAFQPRAVSLTVSADGTLSSGFMGGFRFEAITLTTPGTVVLRGAGLQFGGGYLATASDYQGYFLSSSKAFNTMFYDGAYTEQTDMQPAGTSGATQPSVLDGAKRDRAIWSGDLKIEGQGIADTLGSNGDNYVKQSLLTLITSSQQGGGLNADTLFRTGPYSNSYSSWTLDAATDLLPQHRRHRLRPADPALAGGAAGLRRDPDRHRRADRHRPADIDHQRRLRLGLLRRRQDRHGHRVQRPVLPVPPRRRLHRGQPREHRQGRRVRPDRRPRPGRDQREPAQPRDRHLLPERIRPLHLRAGRQRPVRPVRHRAGGQGARHPQRAEDACGARTARSRSPEPPTATSSARTSPRTRSRPTTWRATPPTPST